MTPRAASNPKSHKQGPGMITKLQKRCKHIINKKYIDDK